MVRNILAMATATVLALAAGAVSAQDINFGSEANRVWWNGMTPNELRELAAEAGATYSGVSDTANAALVSRLEWPDIGSVQAWQGNCNWETGAPPPHATPPELNPRHRTDPSSDMELFRVHAPLWLASTVGDDGKLRLYRYENYAFGTTRGRILGELMSFREYIRQANDLIDEIDDSGW